MKVKDTISFTNLTFYYKRHPKVSFLVDFDWYFSTRIDQLHIFLVSYIDLKYYFIYTLRYL